MYASSKATEFPKRFETFLTLNRDGATVAMSFASLRDFSTTWSMSSPGTSSALSA
jgi:hypothetical protein